MSDSWLFNWMIWASLGAGVCVSGLVFTLGRRIGRRRRQPVVNQEELPWEQLLALMTERYAGRSAADEKLSPDELMDLLMVGVPTTSSAAPEGAEWFSGGERRRARRRWTNPVEVMIISPFHDKPIHGLVVNRSTGGMAILTDFDFAVETHLSLRPLAAPQGVGYVKVQVRHIQSVSRLWIMGCAYTAELPWNVKVWFG
jgi:hypothetical protein